MCGKDGSKNEANIADWGSPPHVRERLRAADDAGPVSGITPACAGKTAQAAAQQVQDEDHPRMCGKDPTSSR